MNATMELHSTHNMCTTTQPTQHVTLLYSSIRQQKLSSSLCMQQSALILTNVQQHTHLLQGECVAGCDCSVALKRVPMYEVFRSQKVKVLYRR